jgi:TonB-linked SusC/RagA family outer membrane protein
LGITAERALGNMSLGTTPAGVTTSSELTDRLVSAFTRVNYSLDKKYLLSFTLRADGSSKFAQGNKWGLFPSGSLAWRISDESFMEKIRSTVSDLKLRVSMGQSGNNRIPNFLYMMQFNPNVFYSVNNKLITAYSPSGLSYPDLKWETTTSRNLGLDLGLWNNRLQLNVDYYHNSTQDLLVNVPIPSTSGYTTQIQNVGSTLNKGVEFQLSAGIIQNKNFNWTSTFNISFNKNKIVSLGPNQTSFLFNSGWAGSNSVADFAVIKDQSVGTIWGLETDGFYKLDDFDYSNGIYTLKTGVPTNQSITSLIPQPGTIKFKDLTGDGIVNINDRKVIGDTSPKFFGGFNQQFTYRNLDLSIFVNFQYGNKILNANKLEFSSGYTPQSNLLSIMNNRWRNVDDQGTVVTAPELLAALNANATLWSPLTTASSFYPHSWAVEDGSFLRINNITLGYSLPAKLLNKVKIDKLRFYATVNNVAIFTNYSGYDPEVNTRRSSPLTPGVDYSAYPRSRAFITGVNLTF